LYQPYPHDIIDKTYRIEAAMEQLAQGLASLGRNGDSMLVHMTPKEVQGLQQLALAKGGSLTINPQTGLPEAGFLSDVFDFAAPIVGGILGGPIGAGLASGLNSYRKTGDLGQALVHGGLGWGLGSLAQGIEGIGGDALSEATRTAAQQAGSESVVNDALLRSLNTPPGLYDSAIRGATSEMTLPIADPRFGLDPVAKSYANALDTSSLYEAPTSVFKTADLMAPVTSDIAQPAAANNFGLAGTTKNLAYSGTADIPTPATPSYADKMKAGFDKVTSSPSEAWNFIKENKYPIGAAGLAAASMMAPQPPASAGPQAKTGYSPQYDFEQAQYDASGRMIKPASYTSLAPRPYTYYAANGGSVPNTFPQSNIEQMAYSKSLANPTPTNVVGIPSSDYDARINQQGDVFTAAEGGKINSFKRPNMPVSHNEPNMPVEPHAAGGSIAGFKLGGSARADAPYQMSGKSSGIYSATPQGPIYGVDSSKVGPYENADAYAAVKTQMDKMSPAKLKLYAEGAKDPIVMAAAQQELYERENTPQGYFTQPAMAQGGTIKMADGGLPNFLQSVVDLAFGPQQQQTPVKYDYDPNRQYYTRLNSGGIASLGGEYAAGGKLLQGPGDGMSDSIPAVIKGAKPQRAALAQGEFVVPADVVSHLGNGSTDAGAKRLYAMMDKVRMARTGNKKQGRQINPEKFMPA
jgi:hypothetical protein